MSTSLISASKNIKEEYCAQVVKIGEMKPIEGSNFLALVMVSGISMVVRKDEFKTGDYAIYCKNETALNEEFLSINNLYEKGEYLRNANHKDVDELNNVLQAMMGKPMRTEEDMAKIQEIETKIKNMYGFFNKNGRVKMIKLRKTPSFGFLIKLETLAKWKPEVKNLDLSKYILNEEMGVGMDFDTVCDELFIKMYVPPMKKKTYDVSKNNKRNKKIEKFERISKEDFQFHYDTNQLTSNIWKIQPDDNVVISVKGHGCSSINANIPVKKPIKLPLNKRFWNWFYKKSKQLTTYLVTKTTDDYVVEYGNVYASRNVIKNQYINKNVKEGFYGTDIWKTTNDIISPYISQGMTVYGEICGYVDNSDTYIQKEYDYGCAVGSNFFMPYRITTKDENGILKEWNVEDVYKWTVKLIEEHPELTRHIKPITILYHGKLTDLYPDIEVNDTWHMNVLERMKADKQHFGMEKNEPLCKNKVPREGICLRVDDDPVAECFKLKCDNFYIREKKSIDNGEVDIEMQREIV